MISEAKFGGGPLEITPLEAIPIPPVDNSVKTKKGTSAFIVEWTGIYPVIK